MGVDSGAGVGEIFRFPFQVGCMSRLEKEITKLTANFSTFSCYLPSHGCHFAHDGIPVLRADNVLCTEKKSTIPCFHIAMAVWFP